MRPINSDKTAAHVWVIAMIAIALVTASGAAPAPTPLLQLGPVAVANGTATLAGSVSSNAAGTTLTVNGLPVGLDSAGAFSASVPLNDASSITLALNEAGSNQQTTFEIPLTGALLGPGGVIPAGVLDALEQAGDSLVEPILATDGKPLTVSGSVLDGNKLSSLGVNGKDVLGGLSDGAFSVQLPGTTKVVTLTATDKNNTAQTTSSSVIHTPLAATTVSAANAVGIRVAGLRFDKKGALRTHRVRLVVTLKDRRGLLIRGAKITVRSTKAGRLVRTPRVTLSGRKGRATVVLRVRNVAFGKRLVVVTLAKTPRAKASRKAGIKLPRAASRQ
jgi:hypothetical protein